MRWSAVSDELRYAVLGPETAMLIVRDYPRFLRELESRGRNLVIAGQEAYGRQVLRGVQQIRAAGEQRLAALTSEVGSPEVPSRRDKALSERVLLAGLTTRDVASRWDVSERQVRNLIGPGRPLEATRVGGRWVIDAVSVAMETERRSSR